MDFVANQVLVSKSWLSETVQRYSSGEYKSNTNEVRKKFKWRTNDNAYAYCCNFCFYNSLSVTNFKALISSYDRSVMNLQTRIEMSTLGVWSTFVYHFVITMLALSF